MIDSPATISEAFGSLAGRVDPERMRSLLEAMLGHLGAEENPDFDEPILYFCENFGPGFELERALWLKKLCAAFPESLREPGSWPGSWARGDQAVGPSLVGSYTGEIAFLMFAAIFSGSQDSTAERGWAFEVDSRTGLWLARHSMMYAGRAGLPDEDVARIRAPMLQTFGADRADSLPALLRPVARLTDRDRLLAFLRATAVNVLFDPIQSCGSFGLPIEAALRLARDDSTHEDVMRFARCIYETHLEYELWFGEERWAIETLETRSGNGWLDEASFGPEICLFGLVAPFIELGGIGHNLSYGPGVWPRSVAVSLRIARRQGLDIDATESLGRLLCFLTLRTSAQVADLVSHIGVGDC